eukprot:GHVO01027451.1.p1 GENE.GHVO01027451.1~~GHVO01027451.1.p1  ORF type:complete len:180 (-),score=25.88 GHVO01027451.1:381-920(-)
MTVRIEMLPPVGCKGEWGYSNLTYAIRIINWKDATRSKCVSGSHVFSTEEPTVSYRPFDQITEFDELKYFLGPNNELVIRAAVKSPPFIPRHEYKIRWTLPDFLSLPDGQRFYSMIGWKEQLSFRIVLYPEDLGVYINVRSLLVLGVIDGYEPVCRHSLRLATRATNGNTRMSDLELEL